MSFGSHPAPTQYIYQSVPAPVAQAPEEIQTEADKAAEVVKKKARQASGRGSTILTSGMGDVSTAPVVAKTLLGS